jgi:hypothetical protein
LRGWPGPHCASVPTELGGPLVFVPNAWPESIALVALRLIENRGEASQLLVGWIEVEDGQILSVMALPP